MVKIHKVVTVLLLVGMLLVSVAGPVSAAKPDGKQGGGASWGNADLS